MNNRINVLVRLGKEDVLNPIGRVLEFTSNGDILEAMLIGFLTIDEVMNVKPLGRNFLNTLQNEFTYEVNKSNTDMIRVELMHEIANCIEAQL